MGHTPGPLRLNAGNEIEIMGGKHSPVARAYCGGMTGIKLPEAEGNAQRIVAAWNATLSIPTPALEAGVVDKLVEAASVAVEELDYIAEFAMRQTEWTGDDDAALLAVKNLRAALALARGEQA